MEGAEKFWKMQVRNASEDLEYDQLKGTGHVLHDTRHQRNLTILTQHIPLKTPLVSEHSMDIGMALDGGIVHNNMSIEDQAHQVRIHTLSLLLSALCARILICRRRSRRW